MAATTYIVLRFKDPDWEQHGDPISAHSADAAIRAIVTEHGWKPSDGTTGTYVAIPARSWKPTHVEIQQTTTLKLNPQ